MPTKAVHIAKMLAQAACAQTEGPFAAFQLSAQDWEAVTIEIKSKEGYVVYRNLYIPHSNSSLSTSLENIPAGIYELTITDEKGILAGEFIYEN